MTARHKLALAVLCSLLGCGNSPSSSSEIIEATIAPATESNRRNTEGDIVVLRDGTLYAAWSEFYGGNSDDSSARIVAARSTDGGRTWGERFVVQANIGQQPCQVTGTVASDQTRVAHIRPLARGLSRDVAGLTALPVN